jgi:predicted enzyme related to lactoylglutathione lyase
MASPALRGRFVWHELLTTSPDAAATFYEKVVGWKAQAWEHDPSYRVWRMGGGPPMGGLMRLPEDARRTGAPPSWLTYIGVTDVDATVRQAISLGARVHRAAQSMPHVGRFAVLADPQRATFAVYTPEREPAGAAEAKPGDFSWNELATTDYRSAWEFYRSLFGWEATESFDMGPEAGLYWMFGRAGKSVGAMYNKPPSMPVPNWLPYIRVRSVDAAAAAAARSGGRVATDPMDVPGGGRIAQIIDPQGALIALHTPPGRAADRPKPRVVRRKKKTAKKKTAGKSKGKRKAARSKAKKR